MNLKTYPWTAEDFERLVRLVMEHDPLWTEEKPVSPADALAVLRGIGSANNLMRRDRELMRDVMHFAREHVTVLGRDEGPACADPCTHADCGLMRAVAAYDKANPPGKLVSSTESSSERPGGKMVEVILFKETGKYYAVEELELPLGYSAAFRNDQYAEWLREKFRAPGRIRYAGMTAVCSDWFGYPQLGIVPEKPHPLAP